MKAIQVNGAIKKFASLPKVWTDENGTHLNITDGEAYGFYDVITPDYNSATQYLGDLEWDADNSVFTYIVVDRTWTETLADLKTKKVESLEAIYNRKLYETDWIITKYLELGESVPQATKDTRSALRAECNTKEAEIMALTTKSAIAEYELPNLN